MATAFISHPDCGLHEMGPLHPEGPYRLEVVTRALQAAGLWDALERFEAPVATREQLERVHDPRHLDALAELVPQEGYVELDLETKLNHHTLTSALRAVGANVQAVNLVADGRVENAFCCVRPPGHHAERKRPVGFCFLNNLAVGAAEALSREGVDRILIVDFDVHHGNGTEDIFGEDPRVMICSTFQALLLPRKLFREHEERLIDVPLPAGSGSEAFRKAVREQWLPAIDRFEPEFVFISAGFDGHWLDTVSGVRLTEADFGWVTAEIKKAARQHAGGRIVSSLEGGYQIAALGASAREHVRALMS